MLNYDFLNLSPSEFENLVRDLLQTRPGIYIESFADGADGGIDFRYTKDSETVVVQCKRYKAFPNLWSVLGKELENMVRQKPDKYILATSVDLSVSQKEQIYLLFKDYMPSAKFILGKKDINNLLSKNPDIEKLHYKLWLSSTAVLERILQSKVYNQSAFEIEKIKRMVKLYVENNSFKESLDILNKSNYVVISGIPGIGKTTLARILSYYLLSNGYEEFIFLSGNIGEGMGNFKEGKKQVFFFDDFLGQNFLAVKPGINEGSLLLSFIDKVGASTDTVLILTTREYILNQAKEVFEQLDYRTVNLNKCIIDLDKYSKTIKAQILVNHLYFSDLPLTYCQALLEGDFYLELVGHSSYSPRIIETVIANRDWESNNPNEFRDIFLNALEHPESIWLKAYEAQISMFSRCVLVILATTGTPIFLDHLELAIKQFGADHNNEYGFTVNPFDFEKSIRELHDSFITTQKDFMGRFVVNFLNPSIRDFLAGYLDRHPGILQDVIKSALYFNQLGGPYVKKGEKAKVPSWFSYSGKIEIDESLALVIEGKVKRDFNELSSCSVSQYENKPQKGFTYYTSNNDEYSKINTLCDDTVIKLLVDHGYETFLAEKLSELLPLKRKTLTERDAFVTVLGKLKGFVKFEPKSIVKGFLKDAYHLLDFDYLIKLKAIIPEADNIINEYGTVIQEFLEDACSRELNNFKHSDLSYVNGRFSSIRKELNLDVADSIEIFTRKSEELRKDIPIEEKVLMDTFMLEQKNKVADEEKEVARIFRRLMHKDESEF